MTTPVIASAVASTPEPTAALGAASAWLPACRLDELEFAWGEVVLVGATQIALFRVAAQEVYAVCNRDPHSGAPVMARGIVGSKGDRATIASPLLKQVYALATGECFADPALHLRTFGTRVADGVIEVEVPA
jgi:nitrite reductase (NADH) small subunit